MSIEGTALNPVRLVAAALIGLVILLVLIIKFKTQAMVAILIGAISIGLIAGLAVGHAFIPPTPGPVLVATMQNVDLGWVIMVGIFCGVFAMIAAGPVWGAICGVVPALSGLAPVFSFLGEPFVALLIATVAAMFILGIRHGYTTEELEKVMTKSLEPTGLILLVTACGGVLRYMLQYSGLGEVI